MLLPRRPTSFRYSLQLVFVDQRLMMMMMMMMMMVCYFVRQADPIHVGFWTLCTSIDEAVCAWACNLAT
jgi:hypothetical protein